MQILIFFLAWAVVSGSSAWSSSEVSCFSCGSECQKACGTRIFRACCFNFQRRRRSGSSNYSLKEMDDYESTEEDGKIRELLPQLFRSLVRQRGDLLSNPSQVKDSWFLNSLFPSVDGRGDLRGDENDERTNALLPFQSPAEGRSLAPWESDEAEDEEEESLDRQAEMGFRRPGQDLAMRRQALMVRYPPSQAKIRK